MRDTGSLFDLVRRLWQVFDESQKQQCLLVLLVVIVAACATLAGVVSIVPFFSVLADPSVVERNSALGWIHEALAPRSGQDFIVSLGIGFVALLLIANAVNLLAIFMMGRFSQRVGARFHSMLFEEYLRRDFVFHSRSNSAALASHVVYDVMRTVTGVIQNMLVLISSSMSIVLIAAAVVVVNPVVALGAALALSLSYVVIYALVRRRLIRNGAMTARFWDKRAKVIAESFAAIKDIIIHRAQKEVVAQVAEHSNAIAAANASTSATSASPKYVLECVTAAGLVAAAVWVYGSADPGLAQLAFFGLAAYRLLPAIQQAFAAVARIRSDRTGFDRIAEDLRRARQHVSATRPEGISDAWIGRPCRDIRLAGVSYRHSPERAGGVIDVSLQIRAGALVGLVGPNGSGKTTLADLILGVLKPDAGRIEIDGVLLDDANRNLWLHAVAYVPQHIVLLDASVAHNIAFGVAPSDIDLERVRQAARDARLDAVIDAMPDGFATVIGQSGSSLSGGQRQRVGIARALYRRASFLVMDEATSSLDALTENEVVALLSGLRGKCTTVLIAHRPSSLRSCDVVLELDCGRLVGTKTPTEMTRGAPSLRQVDKARL